MNTGLESGSSGFDLRRRENNFYFLIFFETLFLVLKGE